VLSANSEANMSVECLMEDEDFHSQIGREELSFGGVAADAA
jgi:molecular chaperone DnaK (HSP70)